MSTVGHIRVITPDRAFTARAVEFIEANDGLDPADAERIRGLVLGEAEEIVIGGGAAPAITIRRPFDHEALPAGADTPAADGALEAALHRWLAVTGNPAPRDYTLGTLLQLAADVEVERRGAP